MKKILVVLFVFLFLGGCASQGYKDFESTGAVRPDAKKTMYLATSLSGGGSGALDAFDITGAGAPNTYDLVDGDSAIVTIITGSTGYSYSYVFDADGTDAESSPTIIRPDDFATVGVWRLVELNINSIPAAIARDIELHSILTLGASLSSIFALTDQELGLTAWPTFNQNTTGTAAIATTVMVADNESTDEENPIVFVAGADPDGGNLGLETDGDCTYNPSTGGITCSVITAGSYASSAADGAHYIESINTVPIAATATAGRIAYYAGENYVADGSDWNDYFLRKEALDTEAEAETVLGFSITVPGELGALNAVTPGANVATALVVAADGSGGFIRNEGSATWYTSGVIQGRALFVEYTSAQTLTAAAHLGGTVRMTTADEVTMWDCETANVGDFVSLWARDAEKIEVVPATGDHFELFDGTALTAGYELDMAATAGTKITLMCTSDDTWSVYNESSASADGGAAD